MALSPDRPPILAPVPAGIPEQMRSARRWAPWRAEWNPKKSKWVKIPHRAARPESGLSNKGPAGWVTFDEAMAAYKARPDLFAGVGYLMTGPHGVTGVDLDNCRNPFTGEIDEWAAELVAKLDTYTEISPSGTGLHAMVAGDVAEDWTNHDRGIEVYGGNEARFLCVTGRCVDGAPATLRAPREGVLDDLAARYRKAKTRAEVEDLHLPSLIPDFMLPDLADLDLPLHARNFLAEGPDPGRDRSQQLFATAIALSQAGLARDEVLSILEANDHAMEIALDHRRQDYDKALRYLWKQHCQAGEARAAQIRTEGYDAFDELEMPPDIEDDTGTPAPTSAPPVEMDGGGTVSADDFDALPDDEGARIDARHMEVRVGPKMPPMTAPTAQAEKRARFAPIRPDEFLKRKPMQWIVKGVLPRAALAVIYGASAAGKTFFAFDLVAAIARGVEWRGQRVTKGRGVYVVAEGAEGFRNRMQAYCDHHGVDPAGLDVLVIPAAPNLMDKEQVKELVKEIQAHGRMDFVVIDTYARTMVGGNENDAKDTGVMMSHCAVIHKYTGALVILIHHSGKDASSGARGSSALRAAADVEIEVIRTREYRAAKVAKMKDGDDSGEFRFNLDIVTIGEDGDGEPVTSCVVRHADGPAGGGADDRPEPKGAVEKVVLSTLAAIIELDGEPSYNDLKEACAAQLPHDETKRDRRGERVTRALDGLVAAGRIETRGGLVFLL